jgi:hypothetical protein
MNDEVLNAISTLVKELRETDPSAGTVLHPVLATGTDGKPVQVRVLVTFDPDAVAELDSLFVPPSKAHT